MLRRAYRLAALVLGLTVASVASAATPPPAFNPADAIPADPAITAGVLPNGVRYIIQRNTNPTRMVSMRFIIRAGSLQESDAQQGLAHFLEHMAFRGSAHVPEAEVWKDIQRLGMGVGADANAYTTFSTTTYAFNLPVNDDGTVDAALLRLRDTASELTLSPQSMDAERGVVLSEQRLRDTPAQRLGEAALGFLFKGQPLAARMPIGKVEVIEHAPISELRAYYAAYYRPERALLVVVGDIDPKVIEAKVKARFSDWTPAGPPTPDPPLGPVPGRKPEVRLLADPKATTAVSLAWVSPVDLTPDTFGRERRDFIRGIALQILTHRLEAADGLIASPSAAMQNFEQSANLATVSFTPGAAGWRAALIQAEQARRALTVYGPTDDELTRAIAEVRATLPPEDFNPASPAQADAVAAATLSAPNILDTPTEALAIFDEAARELKPRDICVALKEVFAGAGPLLLVTSPSPITGGEAALTSAEAEAETAPLTRPVSEPAKAWRHVAFGSPGKGVARSDTPDLGVAFVRFANGVGLTVKPTKDTVRGIRIQVRVGRGLQDLPRTREAALAWLPDAFVQGGLADMSFHQMQRALTPKFYSIFFTPAEDGFLLEGNTQPTDLDTQMQVLAAYATAPGWGAQAFETARIEQISARSLLESSPEGLLEARFSFWLRDGDPRWRPYDPSDLATAKPAQYRALLAGPLSRGRIEVTVAGDTTVDKAIAAVAATFGALPARPPSRGPGAPHTRFPAPSAAPIVQLSDGRADQGVAIIAWPTVDRRAGERRVQALAVLEQIIRARINERLRIALGDTYAPQTQSENSWNSPGYGYISAFTEIPPPKMPLFYDVVASIVADLRLHEVGPDELERARRPLVSRWTEARQTNDYWIGALDGADADPARLQSIRDLLPALQSVTAADVRQAAQEFLIERKAWKLEIRPRASLVAREGDGLSRPPSASPRR